MSSLRFNIIVAMTGDNGIGLRNTLPWFLPKELRNFSKLTKNRQDKKKQNAVIMGLNTWNSIPEKNRPLGDRLNIILSLSLKNAGENVLICPRLNDAMDLLEKEFKEKVENIWVIGGARVYEDGLKLNSCHKLYVTCIHKNFECDVFFPQIPQDFKEISCSDMIVENGISYNYKIYERQTLEEKEMNDGICEDK